MTIVHCYVLYQKITSKYAYPIIQVGAGVYMVARNRNSYIYARSFAKFITLLCYLWQLAYHHNKLLQRVHIQSTHFLH